MRHAWRRLLARLRQLPYVEDGVAAVEFALILPIMLLVYVGSVEASALISMDRRVQSVAGAVGDLVARSDGSISAASLTDYFRAAGAIMTPYPSAGLQQMVASIEVRANGTTRVAWCRQYVNNVVSTCPAHAVNSTYTTLPAEMITIARGKYVIAAKGNYAYTPLYGIVFDQAVRLSRENFFMPRFGTAIAIN